MSEKSEKEKSILICYRVSAGTPTVQSAIEVCDRCAHAVWVALSSPTEVDERICFECVQADPQYCGEEILYVTREQLADIKKTLS